jgi:nitroreductase
MLQTDEPQRPPPRATHNQTGPCQRPRRSGLERQHTAGNCSAAFRAASGHVAGAAAAIAVVAPQPQDDRQPALLQYDLGQATYAMMIAAADLGIGTGHAAATDRQQAKTVLGFPDGRFLAYVLSVSYAADRPMAVINRLNRRPFDEVVHRGRW